MKKERIKEVLNLMLDSIEQGQIDLFNKLIDEKCYSEILNVEKFYFGLIYPYENFLTGLIKSEISKSNDAVFILKNSRFIENHFRYWIEKIEGITCCADKTRTILNHLFEFYKTGKKIEFDYKGEYTYHLPKKIFNEHDSIIEFYESLKSLINGNPHLYFNTVFQLIKN